MSNSLTFKVIEFVTNLDPNVNTYKETALFITNQLRTPLPRWARYLDWCLGFPLLMIFFQSLHLIIYRIKKKNFYFFRMNYLGLIQTNVSIHCSVALGIYSLLSIISIALREFVLAGYDVHGWSDVILGTRSLFLLSASWAHLWVCICHSTLMRLISVGAPSRQLPTNISYSMNTGFIVMLVWPILPITWSFCKASNEHQFVQKSLRPIIDNLMISASTYSSVDYTPLKLFTILIPAQKNLEHFDLIASHVRTGIACYLASCILLCSLYPPVLYVSIKLLLVPTDAARPNQEQARTVITFSVLTFVATTCNIPLLCWMLSFSGNAFLIDSRWWTGMELGLTIPFTIAANINLFVMYTSIRHSTLITSTNHTRDLDDQKNTSLPLDKMVEEV